MRISSQNDRDHNSSSFEVVSHLEGNREVIEVIGILDARTCPWLRRAISGALAHEPTTLQVELAAVPFVDSAGVSVLAGGYRRAAAQGCQFSVTCPSRGVRSALAVARLSESVKVEG